MELVLTTVVLFFFFILAVTAEAAAMAALEMVKDAAVVCTAIFPDDQLDLVVHWFLSVPVQMSANHEVRNVSGILKHHLQDPRCLYLPKFGLCTPFHPVRPFQLWMCFDAIDKQLCFLFHGGTLSNISRSMASGIFGDGRSDAATAGVNLLSVMLT